MTTLVWRLQERPTVDSLNQLLASGILTKEEARTILLNQETVEQRNNDSLEAEIKFLREIVGKLSNRTQIVETIKKVYKPYYTYTWYQPYQQWCGTVNVSGCGVTTSNASNNLSSTATAGTMQNFSSIKTF